MKKILSILCGAVILMTVSSCTKQYVAPATTNETIIAPVASSDWESYSDSVSGAVAYSADITVADLSSDFAKFGGVIVAISYDGGNTYEQLPEVFNDLSFSYTYNNGHVTIYAQSADGSLAKKPTDDIKVKIILVDSNS